MAFGHDRLELYRVSLEYVRWAFELCERLIGRHRHARDQLLRPSQAIPLNIAEGNGQATSGDRRQYFEIARGSALECAAIQGVLEVSRAFFAEENDKGKNMLDRVVASLTKLVRRGYTVQEAPASYGNRFDSDTDTDSDPDWYPSRAGQQGDAVGVCPRRPALER